MLNLGCQSSSAADCVLPTTGRGHKTNNESEAEMLCLWIKPALPILSSCTHFSYAPSVPFSTLPPASLNTLTQTSPQGCQGDGNVILNCCHLCWASTSKKGKGKNDIKNKYVDRSVNTLKAMERQKEEQTGRGEKKKNERPDRLLLFKKKKKKSLWLT